MSKSLYSAPHFNDEAAAYAFVEKLLWADGRVCPHCGVVDRSGPLGGKSSRIGLYKCYACRKPFTVKVGTIFEDSHIAMRDWLTAIQLICSSKKGISANQLSRTLGITLKSAWFLGHRIREAMAPATNAAALGGEGMIVESDETEISYSRKTKKTPARARTQDRKRFVSLVERGGRVRSKVITGAEGPIEKQVVKALKDTMDPKSTLHTDSAHHYRRAYASAKHEEVNHQYEYARDKEDGTVVHVNTAEGYFSIFKRGLVGTYQHMSEQHLHRYLAEFDFRMSNRARLGVNDTMRAEKALKGVVGKRLTYRTPSGQQV
ncbi:MAG TPA: IS1595 family transposase [Rhizomicrobium sp.]|nr:IS1595 family transposase [Rhizomicrobium sp.]